MERKRVVIRKYENRRLYDATGSRYVNLDEIAAMVREGLEIQVVDAATGADLTRLILTQIILGDAKEPGSAFPVDMLRQMVVISGHGGQEALLKYTKAMVEVYQNAWQAISPSLNPLDLLSLMLPGAKGPAADAPRAARGARDEVGELRRRVGELEKRIAERRARRRTKSRSGRADGR